MRKSDEGRAPPSLTPFLAGGESTKACSKIITSINGVPESDITSVRKGEKETERDREGGRGDRCKKTDS